MTDNDKPKPRAKSNNDSTKGKKPPDKKTSSGRPPLLLILTALVTILIGLALAGLWYQNEQRLERLDTRATSLEDTVNNNLQQVLLPKLNRQQSAVEELNAELNALRQELGATQQRLQQTRQAHSELAGLVQGGREEWRLREIEGLLLSANERLLLHQDIRGAQHALTLANQRIAQIPDPRLMPVREQVVAEIALLKALPNVDVEGIALILTNIIERIPNLPLASSVPQNFDPEGPADQASAQGAWQRFVHSVREALQGMVNIQRSEDRYAPLLPPEQEFFLYQNVMLKLEAARLSALRHNSQSFRNSVTAAREWLTIFFDTQSPAVGGVIEQLQQIEKEQLEWQPPEITGSLVLLRQRMGAAAEPPLRPATTPDNDTAEETP